MRWVSPTAKQFKHQLSDSLNVRYASRNADDRRWEGSRPDLGLRQGRKLPSSGTRPRPGIGRAPVPGPGPKRQGRKLPSSGSRPRPGTGIPRVPGPVSQAGSAAPKLRHSPWAQDRDPPGLVIRMLVAGVRVISSQFSDSTIQGHTLHFGCQAIALHGR